MSKSKETNARESNVREDEKRSTVDISERFNDSAIASRAYDRWVHRGCPEGTAEEDWLEAEREFESRETVAQP